MQQDNRPILSLCIPTYGIVEWVIPLVESIYSQGCDESLFEVVITDNGKTDDLENKLLKCQHTNLRYYRTNASGYTNQIESFRRGNGLFCKMINHRSRMFPGSIQKMIDLVNKYKDTKPILYFLDKVKSCTPLLECENLDRFCQVLSYWTSWSGGVGIWREDVDNIKSENINEMFPHAVLLFYIRPNSKYVVWNEQFDIQASDKGKGGYNVFKTFAVIYLNMMHKLVDEGRISQRTFDGIRKDLYPFMCNLYLMEVLMKRWTIHKFITEDALKYMQVYYSKRQVRWMVISGYLKKFLVMLPKIAVKKLLRIK